MTLKDFLTNRADELAPLGAGWPDCRQYAEDVSHAAVDADRWLKERKSYIWKVGVLAQWDSNKCDYAWLFIGHEREPGRLEFIGMLHWQGGENDDIGRCLPRYLNAAARIHPVFMDD